MGPALHSLTLYHCAACDALTENTPSCRLVAGRWVDYCAECGAERPDDRGGDYLQCSDCGKSWPRFDAAGMVQREHSCIDPDNYARASRDASLGVGHVWTNTACPAYRTLDPNECGCAR